jgi:hypothetical protein
LLQAVPLQQHLAQACALSRSLCDALPVVGLLARHPARRSMLLPSPPSENMRPFSPRHAAGAVQHFGSWICVGGTCTPEQVDAAEPDFWGRALSTRLLKAIQSSYIGTSLGGYRPLTRYLMRPWGGRQTATPSRHSTE